MRLARLALSCGLAAVFVSACGSTANPPAGSIPPGSYHAGRAAVDDPRTSHVRCLKAHKLPVREIGLTEIQVGAAPEGPTVVFTPTPGSAQADQINGSAPGAEVIGSALLYPNQAPDKELSVVESCVTLNVRG
jgi:hypothetical protein